MLRLFTVSILFILTVFVMAQQDNSNAYPYYGYLGSHPNYLYYNGYSEGTGKGPSTWEQSIIQRLYADQ
uniref:Secreted protein n=1 Tax=Panagrellus redivivus TaxID=6233 RepID=A0A7E4V167_PANRE